MSSLWVCALGVPVHIQAAGKLPPDVVAAWQDAAIPQPDADTREHAPVSRVVVPDELDDLGDSVAISVTLEAIQAVRGTALMFHACAVALPDGRVVGIVGPSGRGKTTLATLLGAQYGYVSDETLAVQADGTVLPYRKPLSIGRRPGQKKTIAPSELGLRPLPDAPLRLAALVLLDRRLDAGAPRIEPVTLFDAIGELAPETSSLDALPDPLRTLAETIQRTGGVRRLTYADVDDLDGTIDQVLAAGSPCREVLETLPVHGSDPAAGNYSRVAAVDALAVDDDILVLADRFVTGLRGLGPVLWRAADDASEPELVAAALRAVPEAPAGTDVHAVVREALSSLVSSNVLRRGEDPRGGSPTQQPHPFRL